MRHALIALPHESVTAGQLTITGDVFDSPPGALITTGDRVLLPTSGLFNATQGWVAARLTMGFDAAGAGEKYVFSWRTDNNNRIGIAYGRDLTRWQGTKQAAGAGSGATLSDNYGSSGAKRTVVYGWTAADHKVSFNGSVFTSAANTSVPSLPADADIGSFTSANALIDSNVLWFVTGSGTLTDADAAYLNSYGDNPPSLDELISVMPVGLPTAVWDATTSAFAKAA